MLERLLRQQGGVLTRAQAHAAGLTDAAVKARIASGRWQRLRPGVYAAFSGPVPRRSLLWSAVLAAGPGAVLSHESAAELAGLAPGRPARIHVTVPVDRKVRRMPGVVVHRSARVDQARHPVLEPPQTRIEETIIDLTQTVPGLRDAYGWVTRAVNARLTTAERLLAAVDARAKVRRRRLLREGLGQVAAGCRSVLELAYLRDVERAHGLPAGQRQSALARGGGRLYVDVHYRRYATRVELDGLAAIHGTSASATWTATTRPCRRTSGRSGTAPRTSSSVPVPSRARSAPCCGMAAGAVAPVAVAVRPVRSHDRGTS